MYFTDVLSPEYAVQARSVGFASAGKATATLMLYPPKEKAPQVIRPVTYSFDEEFCNSLQQVSQQNINSLDAANYINNSNQAVLPSSVGVVDNSQSLNGKWTFTLIIDNDSAYNRASRPFANTKRVYSGIVVDEDVSGNNYGQGNAVNDQTHLFITHVNSYSAFNDTGIIQSLSNVDVHNAYITNTTCPTADKLITPLSTYKSSVTQPRNVYEPVDQNSSVSIMSTDGYDFKRNNAVIHSALSSPIHHRNTIVSHVVDTIKKCSEDANPSSIVAADQSTDILSAYGEESAALDSHIGVINVNTVYTIRDLITLLPNLEITCIKNMNNCIQPITWTPDLNTNTSMLHILGSAIASTLATICSDCLVTYFSFTYNRAGSPTSVENNTQIRIKGALHVDGIGCIGNQATAVQRVFDSYEMMITPMLTPLGGQYCLNVLYDMGDRISVQISSALFGESTENITQNLSFGGAGSGIAGFNDVFMNDTKQMVGLKEAIKTSAVDAYLSNNGCGFSQQPQPQQMMTMSAGTELEQSIDNILANC